MKNEMLWIASLLKDSKILFGDEIHGSIAGQKQSHSPSIY